MPSKPLIISVTTASAAETTTTAGGIAWVPFSQASLDEAKAAGKPVFIDFTADWCITCKVNEHVALNTQAVHQAFSDNQVVWMQGDWTRADPAITELLNRYGRSGVPLYLLYVKGAEPKVLPQILTPSLVVDALKPS